MYNRHCVMFDRLTMIKIFAICVGFLGLGALLASDSIAWPLRPGYLGGALLVGMAFFAKRRWEQLRTDGVDPSATERAAWVMMSGTALICAFVAVTLTTPGAEVHRVSGDTGGYDSWVMFAGAVVAWALLRERRAGQAAQDERDTSIDQIANRVGYTALVVMLIAFLLLLGFAPRAWMARFTHWLIANTLLNLIMWACLAQYLAQLICYWRDARALAASESAA